MKKNILIFNSLFLGILAIMVMFAPQEFAATVGLAVNPLIFVLLQIIGALYFAMAFMNWTAKDSPMGGIYARPVSLANLTHFTIGALALIKYQIAQPFNLIVLTVIAFYTFFALYFGWLVFKASGLEN